MCTLFASPASLACACAKMRVITGQMAAHDVKMKLRMTGRPSSSAVLRTTLRPRWSTSVTAGT